MNSLRRGLIVKVYGEFKDDAVYGYKNGVYCHSRIFDNEEFGYNKIVVERPTLDENGQPVLKKANPLQMLQSVTRRMFR